MKQKMTGWQWHQLDHMQIIFTSLQTDNHASTSSLNFLQAGCSFCHPTNGIKALTAKTSDTLPVLLFLPYVKVSHIKVILCFDIHVSFSKKNCSLWTRFCAIVKKKFWLFIIYMCLTITDWELWFYRLFSISMLCVVTNCIVLVKRD